MRGSQHSRHTKTSPNCNYKSPSNHQNGKHKSKRKDVSRSKIGLMTSSNHQMHPGRRGSQLSEREKAKGSVKMLTNDDSSQYLQSKMGGSVLGAQKRPPNEEYFQHTCFPHRQKKGKESHSRSKSKESMNSLVAIQRLVREQDSEVRQLGSTLSQKQLHRLVKIHSTQKLQLLARINSSGHS